MSRPRLCRLDSDTLKALEGIQFAAISEQRLRYKLTFTFLPEEMEDLDELLKETAVVFVRGCCLSGGPADLRLLFRADDPDQEALPDQELAAAFLKLMELAWIGYEHTQKVEAAQSGAEHSGEVQSELV